MRFKDITGHRAIKSALAQGVDRGRVSHAQLFVGESGYGALPLALAYAQYVNCSDRRDGDSCGECPSCRKISELAHPDLHFVFPVNSPKGSGGSQKALSDAFLAQWRTLWAETDGVFDEQAWYSAIRIDNQQGIITRNEADEMIRKLSFKSFEAPYKIMLIWLPERMRTEAANALLKILEEPWERTLFLLVGVNPDKLLPTILSRVQRVMVPAVDLKETEELLRERYGVEEGKAGSIARLSGGNIIEARRLAGADEEGVAAGRFEMFASLMRLSYNDRHLELFEWAETAAAMGREEQKRYLQYAVKLLRESYMLNAGMDEITGLWGEELTFCRNFSPFIGNHNIEALVAEMELTLAQISQNGNPRIIFTHHALAVSKMVVK